MENFIKKSKGNNIIFKDIKNSKELVVIHNDDEHIFDTIFIDDKYDITFINYIVKELKQTNDLAVMFSLNDSLKLEKLLFENDLRISNYQYSLENRTYSNTNHYSITNKLDDESKQFYLQTINQLSAINHEYFNPNSKFVEYDETWFQNEKYIYRIYRKNNKVVGIVDYMVFEDNPNYGKPTNEVFNYNNKLCIRCLFAIEEKVLEDILKDLSNIYKKDIIISITYTDNILRKVVKKMNGKFNYCQYILVNN